ncbi:MAG TPA: hypothetical protein QGI62_09785 [Anaerolineales bacterium]|nr:hypothetical protein [Anaerolineales bacterium]
MPMEADDIIARPFEEQLLLAGAECAHDSFHYTFNRMRMQSTARLRKSGWP